MGCSRRALSGAAMALLADLPRNRNEAVRRLEHGDDDALAADGARRSDRSRVPLDLRDVARA
jgi:hypothetical protein